MKKYIPIFIILFSIVCNAQQLEFPYGQAWRLGLNFGGTRVRSDLSNNYAGGGIGFTIEKGLTKSENRILSFDLRYRFLSGTARGKDTRKNLNLADNSALNGDYNSNINYNTTGGYFLNNYRTSIVTNDVELKIGLNRLLSRKKIHLYFWGGLGFAKFNTKINALNGDSLYDLSSFDTLQSVPISSIDQKFDSDYETNANGNKGNGFLTFAPSLG
ncbi:MAG: hypothetical protein ACK452_12870, partial [Bacteroidota bacterium]